jgi:hypothetical protein
MSVRPGSEILRKAKMKTLPLSLFLLCGVLFIGCAHVPMASSSADAAAKQFQAEPLKANIYITKPGRWWYSDPYPSEAFIDGRVVGFLAPDTFMMLSVLPGEHTVAMRMRNDAGQEPIHVVWGTNYFFEFKPGPFRYRLVPVPEEQGRKQVMKAKRVQASTYE